MIDALLEKEILDLYDRCLEDFSPFHLKLDLFIIPADLSQLIFDKTALDVTGFMVSIDNYGIKHILEQHGNPISEAKRGQIAIQREDFIKWVEVFLNPDDVQLIGNTKHTRTPVLQFSKHVEDKMYVLKEVRTVTSNKKNKISRLMLHTMYKIKATKQST